MKAILGGCLDLVLASELGAIVDQENIESKGNGLRIVKKGARRYLNIDVTTRDGIMKAKPLDPIGSGLADVIVTPSIDLVVENLLSARRGVKTRLFGIFRDPIKRAASLFYYLQTVSCCFCNVYFQLLFVSHPMLSTGGLGAYL